MRQAQYELVSKSALRAVPLNIVNALLLTAILHPYVNTLSLWIWAGLLCVGPFVRFSAMLRARRADRAPTETEMYLYIALSAVVGLAWGATPHLLSSNTPTLVSQIVGLVIAGMAAGAVLTSAGERRVIFAYAAPSLTLWAIALIRIDVSTGAIGAVMIAGFLLGIAMLAKTYANTLLESVAANLALEEANKKTLEQASALARLAEHNDQAARKAEETARSSAVMLANMSHELRSPLNGVLGMGQLLDKTRLSDEQSLMVARLLESGEKLEGLINTVLEVSRIDAGRMELVVEDITASDLADRLRREHAPHAAAKNISLDVTFEGEGGRALRADGGRLMHMCRILVGNAIRFTDEGGVTIRLTMPENIQGLSTLRIAVEDTGSGVPESSREQLFNAMGKDAIDENIKQAGTGLGLHLVRKLAEMMHGEASYQPAENGTGSIFWFEVKLRHSIKADRFADGEQMSVSSRRLRILVGESDPALRSVLLGYLKSFNCVVTCSGSSVELVDELGASAYDAVILGQELEDGEAEDASADVRALPSTAAMTPIVRLVPDLDAPLRVNAMETQVRSPVSAELLMDGLKQALANDPIANAQLYRIA
ncbi:HAMP domain-containing sensor histidine kinase [Oceanicaulis sp. MMSF_3324]|uniref:ATP-binding response regulator n=1 Tax=Oceanicaulis sp. MMSF_3324 TaxID=3046702 RepID=UPI00273D0CFB|nr:HAMP domain-containing sensor histidine kinase [Oceanicaulis sp. MMSF_3324]